MQSLGKKEIIMFETTWKQYIGKKIVRSSPQRKHKDSCHVFQIKHSMYHYYTQWKKLHLILNTTTHTLCIVKID
jgi:hypothetical protein